MFSKASVWLCLFLIIVTALIPDLIVKTTENILDRYKVNKLKELNQVPDKNGYVNQSYNNDGDGEIRRSNIKPNVQNNVSEYYLQ
jgi:hypothetical protein